MGSLVRRKEKNVVEVLTKEEGSTHEFLDATLVDEDWHGDAEDGEDAEVLGGKPEAPLHHLARQTVRLDERVGLDVGGVARTSSHCCLGVGKKKGRGEA